MCLLSLASKQINFNSDLILKVVIKLKKNVKKDTKGNIPITRAAEGGHSEIVQMLLDAGACVNEIGGHYGTALQLARTHGRDNVVQMLLNAGAVP